MKRLSIKELQFLRCLYAKKGPKYIPTVGLLDHFNYRFENHPEWMDKVQFLTINESTLNDGTFVMDYATVDGFCISFNSLESKPYRNLEHLLTTLNYSKGNLYEFLSIPEDFQILIENLVKANNLEILENKSTKCHVFKYDASKLLKMLRKAPEGFYYDSLKESDIPNITSILSYKLQPGYLEAIIKYNPTTALYTAEGELVAWAVLHETGESGMLEVLEKYKKRGFGRELVLRQSLKLLDMGRLLFRHIHDDNNVGNDFSERVNERISDGISAGKFRFITAIPRARGNSGKFKL